eukprot:jgi/Hompol1/1724/HPOL_001925-RA
MAIFQSLNLYTSPETYTFEPAFLDPSIARESLVVRRSDGTVLLNAPPAPNLAQEEVSTVHGIVGIIRLNAGDHIIIITGRKRVGSIAGNEIFALTEHKILPVQTIRTHLTERMIQDDALYLSMISDLLASGFYFSYTYDLTHTVQRRALLGQKESLPLWQRVDERFYWNKFLQAPLIEMTQSDPLRSNLSRFILPIICGFVEIINTSVHAKPITFALISRRSKFRAGTRYHSRGINDRGYVSNYVETEQIVELDNTGQRSSYVQTRGSIPLFWRQVINVKYQPKLVIEQKPNTLVAVRNHFMEQIDLYGGQVVVNLINKHGYESQLGTWFARRIMELKEERIREFQSFIHFDFHEQCRKMRWDRISVLVDAIEGDLQDQGYCEIIDDRRATKLQQSVVRTNCMDCLDRTNVVQSVLARRMLEIQLRAYGILDAREQISHIPDFEKLFKNIWADNADEISKQYSGTGALKTDFTRTGKRSTSGALQDFMNSVVRYVRNNYMDGYRQDAYDLFLGHYRINQAYGSPFAEPLITPRALIILAVLVIAVLVVLYAVLIADTYLATFYYLTLAGILSAASVQLILIYSDDFVSHPRLVPDLWFPNSEDAAVAAKDYDIQMSDISAAAASVSGSKLA